MKIGDKVRFLSEVGGGVISGFQGKDMVLVEDEDGFDIPMLRSQVVVIDTNEYNFEKKTLAPQPKAKVEEPVQEERPVTFKAPVLERKGGDVLNVYLSFVPNNAKEMNTTNFEAYIINDSNYFVQVLYMNAQGTQWHARFSAIIEPNTKQYVETFDRTILNDLERICLQTMAWKQDKDFALKPALSTEIRLDVSKFYKFHVFQPNEFFRDPNWTIPVVRDDESVRTRFVDAGQLREALMGNKESAEPHKVSKPAQKNQPNEPLEVDLHAHQLLDNTNGLSNSDILLLQMKEFRRVMDENIKQRGKKIVFIHGKGDGVLRKTIIDELKYRYKTCTWQDASFREYGFGATLVKIG